MALSRIYGPLGQYSSCTPFQIHSRNFILSANTFWRRKTKGVQGLVAYQNNHGIEMLDVRRWRP